jgi:hypothetical protein
MQQAQRVRAELVMLDVVQADPTGNDSASPYQQSAMTLPEFLRLFQNISLSPLSMVQ